MRRYAVMLKRRQRNTITLRQLFNEWLPIHSQSISDSAVKSYHIAFKHISNIADMPITNIHFQHLQNVINSMHAKGLSYSSCKKVPTGYQAVPTDIQTKLPVSALLVKNRMVVLLD